MFSSVQQMLETRYGPGDYLTNGGLDWSAPVTVEPRFSAGLTASGADYPHIPDRFIPHEVLPYGAGAMSCDFFSDPLGLPAGYDGVYLFAAKIKDAGNDVHVLPRQLGHIAPLIQQISSLEYAFNPDTHDKYGAIMMRTLPLKPDVAQVSENDWHAHRVLTRKYLEAGNRIKFLEIDADMMRAVDDASTDVVQVEYLFSNCCGSLVQTQKENVPMDMHSDDGTHRLTKSPAHFRQTADGEIVRSNSLVFHCAATPQAQDIGKLRTLLFVGYTASKTLAARLALT